VTPKPGSQAPSHSTTFGTDQNHLSEGGLWTNGLVVGLDWQNMKAVGGAAVGASISTGYDDCVACLSGYPTNQFIEGVVYKAPGYSPPGGHEIQLLLRATLSANLCRTYECLVDVVNGTFQIVRWRGPYSDFDFSIPITFHNGGPVAAVNGDLFRFQCVSSAFEVYQNTVKVMSFTDSGHSAGSPGIAAYWLNAGNNGDSAGWANIVTGSL
jgi:hypothetical protein